MTDYSFTQDWFHWAPPVLERLTPLLPGRKRFLEIGSFEGRSTVWLAENMLEDNGCIIAIDTWEGGEEHESMNMGSVEDRFDDNMNALKEKLPRRYVSKVKETSYNALAMLVGGGTGTVDPYDLIYVDGSHVAKDVLTDLCMTWPLLKVGGVMVMDDYLWGEPRDILHRPKMAIDAFMNVFAEEQDILHVGYQVAVRKKG